MWKRYVRCEYFYERNGAPCWKSFLGDPGHPEAQPGSGCSEPARPQCCCCRLFHNIESMCRSSKLSNLHNNRLMQSLWLETDKNSPDWARPPSSGTQLQQQRPPWASAGSRTWRLPPDRTGPFVSSCSVLRVHSGAWNPWKSLNRCFKCLEGAWNMQTAQNCETV